MEEGFGDSGLQGCCDVCRENIRKSKAQLERNLISVVKDIGKCFCKYMNNKRRAKENLHSLLDAGGKQSDPG